MSTLAEPLEMLPPAQVLGFVLVDLALILLAARLVGGIFVRLRQPRVVGEMLAGILIGPTVLGGHLATAPVGDLPGSAGTGLTGWLYPLQAYSFLNLLGGLGLVIFTFLVGLEVPQRLLRGRAGQIATVSLAVVIVPIALGFALATVLDEPGVWKVAVQPDGAPVTYPTQALFIGCGLAATALPVIARILQEKRLIDTQIGAVGMGAAAAITVLTFVALAAAVASAQGHSVPASVAVTLALSALLLAVLFLLVRPLLARLLARRFRPGAPLGSDLMAILLVGALLSGAAADRIGINALTGGLLFGAAVPQVAGLGAAVIGRLQPLVVVLLVPVFLATSGLQTDLTVLTGHEVLGVLLFLGTLLLGKWGAGAVAGRVAGLSWSHANGMGVLMSCGGLITLVVAMVGRNAGVITDAMQVSFVLAAIVTTLITGPLLDVFLPRPPLHVEPETTLGGE